MVALDFLLGALGKPEAIDFADIAGNDKGINGIVFYKLHEVSKLTLGQQTLNLSMGFHGISSFDIVNAASSYKIVDDVISDGFGGQGDDAYTLTFTQTGSKVIYYYSVEPGADNADDD